MTAALLFGQFFTLRIWELPMAFCQLGLITSVPFSLLMSTLAAYTSLSLWRVCLRHPELRDICDVVQLLLQNKSWAWWATSILLFLNNTYIQTTQVLGAVRLLNFISTASQSIEPSLLFMVVPLVCLTLSLGRTFTFMSIFGIASFSSALISLAVGAYASDDLSFRGQAKPLEIGAAFIQIMYTTMGHVTLPSFIAEMRDPW
jgi:hypothetical protein